MLGSRLTYSEQPGKTEREASDWQGKIIVQNFANICAISLGGLMLT